MFTQGYTRIEHCKTCTTHGTHRTRTVRSSHFRVYFHKVRKRFRLWSDQNIIIRSSREKRCNSLLRKLAVSDHSTIQTTHTTRLVHTVRWKFVMNHETFVRSHVCIEFRELVRTCIVLSQRRNTECVRVTTAKVG